MVERVAGPVVERGVAPEAAALSGDQPSGADNPWLTEILASRDTGNVIALEARRMRSDTPSDLDNATLTARLGSAVRGGRLDGVVGVEELPVRHRAWWQRFGDFDYALRAAVSFDDGSRVEVRVPDLTRATDGRRSVDDLDVDAIVEVLSAVRTLQADTPGTSAAVVAFDQSLPAISSGQRTAVWFVTEAGVGELHVDSRAVVTSDASTTLGSALDGVEQAWWAPTEAALIVADPSATLKVNRILVEGLGLSGNPNHWFAEPDTEPTDAQQRAQSEIAGAFPHRFSARPCTSRRELLEVIFEEAHFPLRDADDEPSVVSGLRAYYKQTLGVR